MRAEAVADGQLVEIPALHVIRTVGTQEDKKTGEWKNPGKRKVISVGKSAGIRRSVMRSEDK